MFKHELSGRLIDAATFARVEAPLGLYVRTSMKWGDTFIGKIFDAARQAESPAPTTPDVGNGTNKLPASQGTTNGPNNPQPANGTNRGR